MEGSVSVQVCKTWVQNADGTVGCTHLEWIQTYLIPPEAAGYVDILVNGGFSPEAFGIGAAGVLGSFVTGLLIGWVASLLRKAK